MVELNLISLSLRVSICKMRMMKDIYDEYCHFGLPRWLSGKESACQCRRHRR